MSSASSTPVLRTPRCSGRRPFTFDRVVRILFTAVCVVAAVLLIDRLKDVLLPFLVAWLIAYILEPFVKFNARWLHARKRFWPVILTLLEALVLAGVLGVIFIPSIIDECHQLGALVSSYAESDAEIRFIPAQVHDFIKRSLDLKSLASSMSEQEAETIFRGVTHVLSGSLDFVIGIFNWFLVVLYVIFIMLDYERLLHGFKALVPPKYRGVVFRVGHDVKDGMNHYFRGQALVSLCVGIIFAIGFSIIGLPLGVMMGLFIGVLNMVPYLQLISIIPTTLLCVVYSAGGAVGFWTVWVECIALYCVCQGIQDLFLTPHIMGKVMGLNPAIILLSLSVWGTLLGLIGMIIALPLTTLLISYYNRYIIRREFDGKEPETADARRALKDMATED